MSKAGYEELDRARVLSMVVQSYGHNFLVTSEFHRYFFFFEKVGVSQCFQSAAASQHRQRSEKTGSFDVVKVKAADWLHNLQYLIRLERTNFFCKYEVEQEAVHFI